MEINIHDLFKKIYIVLYNKQVKICNRQEFLHPLKNTCTCI